MLVTQIAWDIVLLYLHLATVNIVLGNSSNPCSTSGDLRLVGGSVPSEGRVEVCVNGEWGTVCDRYSNWDAPDIQVVCRQLGYHSIPTGYNISYFYPGTDRISLTNVRCTGSEIKLVYCSYSSSTTHCGHSYDVAIRCHDVCSVHGDLRLVGGRVPSEGRVEVCVNGAWGTVCDRYGYWDARETQVVCQQLGRRGGTFSSYRSTGTGPILLDRFNCQGSERKLVDCSYNSYSCDHSQDIAVTCPCIDYEVRLDNQSFSGSVESCLSYNWQSITIVSTASVSVSVVGATRLRVQWTPLVDERISLSAYHEVVCKFISSDITSPVEGQNTLFKRVPPSIQSTTINGVWPRSIYNCCVRVSVSNTLSLPTCASNIFSSSVPPLPQDLSVIVLSSRQVLLQWKPHTSVMITGLALTYRVSVSGQTYATPNTSILLDSLSPRSSYTFSVQTCFSPGSCGSGAMRRKGIPEDAPSAMPLDFRGEALSATAIRLYWSPPQADSQNGVIIGYKTRVVSAGSEILIDTPSTTTNVSGLSPSQLYRCFVSAYTQIGNGPSAEYSLKTREGTPLVPRFTVTRLTATEISVDIEPLTLSEERRGEITSYHVLWKQKPQNTLNCGTITNAQIKSSLNTSLILLNLDPWQEYCVTVSAETSAGVGNHSTATVVELYSNTPVQVLFALSTTCDMLDVSMDYERERLESTLSDVLSEKCSCPFSPQYIAQGQLTCSGVNSNCVVFRGRLIGTHDADSVELLLLLQQWLRAEPDIQVGMINLQAIDQPLIYSPRVHNGDLVECERPSTLPTIPVMLIATACGSGILALVAVISIIIAVASCIKLKTKSKKHRLVQNQGRGRENDRATLALHVSKSLGNMLSSLRLREDSPHHNQDWDEKNRETVSSFLHPVTSGNHSQNKYVDETVSPYLQPIASDNPSQNDNIHERIPPCLQSTASGSPSQNDYINVSVPPRLQPVASGNPSQNYHLDVTVPLCLHSVASNNPPQDYVEDMDDQGGEYYVPSSDEEELEQEDKDEVDGDSLPGSDCTPPPVPSRCPVDDELEDDTFLNQDFTFKVNWELHNAIQGMIGPSKADGRDSSCEDSPDKKASQALMEAPMSVSVNWNTHLLLQSLAQKETELPTLAEHEPSVERYDQTSESIYQPLIPPRREEMSSESGNADYQPLTLK